MTAELTEQSKIDDARREYDRDGAAVLRGVVNDRWVQRLREGTERLMSQVGTQGDLNRPGEGRFFNDVFASLHISEYRDFIFESGIAEIAAKMMRSKQVRFFYDQPLIKEPGTPKPTPWHQDSAYWPCDGWQVMSIWVPLDPATPESGVVSYVKGSHRWNAYYPLENWSDVDSSDGFAERIEGDRDISENPGPDATVEQPRTLADIRDHPERYDFTNWNVDPGDVLIHHMHTIHGAPGNRSQTQRRRAVAFRFFGDDARWDDTRPHFLRLVRRLAPDFPYPDLRNGDPMDTPIFPVVWNEAA